MAITRKTLLWLVPVVITIHNLEEAIFMPAFLQTRNSSIPSFLRELLPPLTYAQFLAPLILVTAIPYLIAGLTKLDRDGSPGINLLLGVQVVMLINVLAHTAMAVVMWGYAPGLITALLINLPFSLYLLHRATREQWVSRRVLVLLLPIGVLIHVVGLPGLMILSASI
jgi:hypothetical protein